MVYPVYEYAFRIGTKGLASTEQDMKTIANMETFEISFDNGIEEFNPIDKDGWKRVLMTAKGLTITLSGKVDDTDEGNLYLQSMELLNGREAMTKFEYTTPDGKTKLSFDACVSVTSTGGDSTSIDALEATITCDGKPELTHPGV